MKTAISLPDEVFAAAEQAAKRLGLSRSQFYQRAIASYLERHREGLVTEALDEVYAAAPDELPDAVLSEMQRAGLVREAW
jgi:predicted transcriptional regulator